MEWIICYIIATYGLTNLLVYGSGPYNILGKLRDYTKEYCSAIGEMLECMMCTSTNIGWVTSLLNILLFPMIPFTPFNLLIGYKPYWLLIIIADACFTSGIVWLIHTIQEAFERWNNN